MHSHLSRRHWLGHTAAGAAVLALSPLAKAAGFPARPVTIVVPYPAGGATDVLLRSLAGSVGATLGQPLVIENRPGAAGMLAPAQLLRAQPDGYTLAILAEAAFRIPQLQKAPFDPLKDFTYIAHLAGYRFTVAVRADAPWKTWQDVVADAKKRPGQITYGSTGINGTMHFTMEELMQKAGVSFNHIPYKGEAEITTALLGGQVDLGIASGPFTPHVSSGKLRTLMQWTNTRSRRYPDVPTLRDLGYDMVSMSPFGLVGPKGMSPSVVQALQEAFRTAIESAEGREALERVDLESAYLGSRDYAAYAREQFERQRRLIERLGIKPAP